MTEFKAIILDPNGYGIADTNKLNSLFNEGWEHHETTAQIVSASTGSTGGKVKHGPLLVILKKEKLEL